VHLQGNLCVQHVFISMRINDDDDDDDGDDDNDVLRWSNGISPSPSFSLFSAFGALASAPVPRQLIFRCAATGQTGKQIENHKT